MENKNDNSMEQLLKTTDQVLKIVERQNIAYASSIWVPSLNRDVRFNEINTGQQKRLIKSIVDSPIYNTEFIYTLRDILKENCVEPGINVEDLTVLDKLLIAIGLRTNSIGNKVEIEVQTKNDKKINITLDLNEIYELAKNTIKVPSALVISDEFFSIECCIPTIKTEYMLELELRNHVDQSKITNKGELRNTIGDVFIGELVKYINKVSIKDKDEFIPVDWQHFTFTNRIKIVETFKTKLLKQILDYVGTIKTELDKVEVVNFTFEDETFSKRLTIDGRFFTIS